MTELTCYHAHETIRPEKCNITSSKCVIGKCKIYLNKDEEENRLFHEHEDRMEAPRGSYIPGDMRGVANRDPGDKGERYDGWIDR
jgi:hypothetical protein